MRANGGKMHFGPIGSSHFVTKTLNLPGSIEHLCRVANVTRPNFPTSYTGLKETLVESASQQKAAKQKRVQKGK